MKKSSIRSAKRSATRTNMRTANTKSAPKDLAQTRSIGRDLTGITTKRNAIASLNSGMAANATKLTQAEAARIKLARQGGTSAQLKRADAKIATLRAKHKQLTGQLRAEADALAGLTDVLAREVAPEALVGTLDGGAPILMLPVRLETRFFNSGTELRVRIYPDQMHINAHEPELTEHEEIVGKWYWEQVWSNPPVDVSRGAWREAVTAFGIWRACWVARSLTPTNMAARGTATPPQFPATTRTADVWTRPIQATALPDRWVVIGYRGTTELFRKWGEGVPDALNVSLTPDPANLNPDPPADQIPIDDGMRWTVDYDDALKRGMAVTVTNADLPAGQTLARGLTRLIVLGVDWTLKPEQAAAAIGILLHAHAHADGFAFVPPGTPTNNTGSVRSGLDEREAGFPDALDPVNQSAGGGQGSASQLLERALGLPANSAPLDRAPGARMREQRTAAHVHNALWRSTLGYYLDEMCNADGDAPDRAPLIDDATLEHARDHVEQFLRPGGPLPTVRVGKQPYGVLPVVAPTFTPAQNDLFSGKLLGLLSLLRPFWLRGVGNVPRVGSASSRDALDDALLKILQTTPLASSVRFRRVIGSATAANTLGLKQYEEIQADIFGTVLGRHFRWTKPPRISEFVTDPRSHKLPVPWVQAGGASVTERVQPNYIEGIAGIMRGSLGSDARAALAAQEDGDTLLQSLLAHAALEEIDHSAIRLVLTHNRNVGRVDDVGARPAGLRVAEMLFAEGLEPRVRTTAIQTAQVYSRRELANVILPTVTNTLTVAEFVTQAMKNVTPLRQAEMANLASFLASLDVLQTRPSAEIERAFRGMLDAYSHRLDAWYTSLATRRLNELRTARSVGLHIGGYGWVENLRPDTRPDSLGYVHAPSIPQAIAAAVLRSGHLSHQTGESAAGQSPLNIDMSSRRVRLALDVINGVARGQPLAALLGYRFERSLRERDITLARFILPFRLIAPLRPNTEVLPAGQSVESVAARDVVDGVALLDLWRRSRANLFTLPQIAAQSPNNDARAKISEELDRLADVLDAASDVLLSESVYQTVLGNYERAGAAAAALDRQERPAEPQVVHTPRTGKGYAQRVLVLLGAGGQLAGWAALSDPRAQVEPRVNAWVGSLLGNPGRIRLAARVLHERADGNPPDEVRRLVAPVTALGLSPLSLTFASAPGGQQKPSELEERAAMHFASLINDGDEHTIIELLDAAPANAPAGSIGLGELRALLNWIRAFISNRRAVDARDLALAESQPIDNIQPAELATRATALKATLAQTISNLKAATTAPPLRTALMRAAALNAPNALPRITLNDAAAISQLMEQARDAVDYLEQVQAEIAKADAAIAGRSLGPLEASEHQAACIRLIFGKAFPVLPLFGAENSVELTASRNDQSALNNNDVLAAAGWLRQMALVRPDVRALSNVLSAATLLGSAAIGPSAHTLMQLPHTPGQRWLALPVASGAEATGDLAILAHIHGTVNMNQPLAGFACDEWTEVIPSATETTALTFQYDAPGARPPHMLLLAVPPEPNMQKWNFQALLDTVNEAWTLGQLRAIGPKEMEVLAGNLLPAVFLPNNFTKDVPSVDLFKVRAKYLDQVVAKGVLGKEYLKG